MHQQSLEDVVVTPQVRPPHAARVVQVRVRTFQEFATFPQQPLTAFAVNPAPIRVHRVPLGMLINPALRRTIRFTDVSAEAHVVELPDLRPAVIALVGHDPLAIWIGSSVAFSTVINCSTVSASV